MVARLLFVFVLVMLAAGTARAQAPGETTPVATDLMARRWSIELGLGAASLKTKGADDAAGFGTLGAAGRFRITPAIELALGLALGGGELHDTKLSTGALYVDFRYRFLAENEWNVFALAGLGVASIAGKMATDDEKRGRGMLRLGGGVERRFGALAVDATLRIVGIAEHADLPLPDSPDTGFDYAHLGVSGLALAIDGVYYF
jgi:outer membrane protein with beta-barrel domain